LIGLGGFAAEDSVEVIEPIEHAVSSTLKYRV
jgi:hypothetical protein